MALDWIRLGRRPNGERLVPVHPYPVFNGMAEEDLRALVSFLRSVPPVNRSNTPKKITVPMFESVFLPAWLAAFAPRETPQVVISGLPLTGDHPMHPFAIDATGALYLVSASATIACQARNRMKESPGLTPCRELETRAGVWRYDAKATNQQPI